MADVNPFMSYKGLYIGAGKHRMEGWLHLDRYPFEGIDVVADVVKGLPFPDNSFGYVYSQDFMEHLPPEAKVPVINEIWRVLKPGGLMEHRIPNAGTRNDFGSPSHLSHWNLQTFEHFDVQSYRYETDKDYEGITSAFSKVFADLVTPVLEEGGVLRYQSIHVRYKAIK